MSKKGSLQLPVHRPAGGWKVVWGVLLSAAVLWSCAPERPPQIETVRFGRQVLEVVLNGKGHVAAVSVYDGTTLAGQAGAGTAPGRTVVETAWQPGHTYRIQAALKELSTPLEISVTAPAAPEPMVTGSLALEEKVNPWQLTESRYLGGRTAISADGRFGAVGTEDSRLLLLKMDAFEPLWTKRLGEGRLLFLTFTPAGDGLLVGEQSRDGFLYCFETTSGRLRWRFRAADVVGESESGSGRHPVFDYIALGRSDPLRCYAAAKRQYWKDGDYFYHTRMLCLDIATGREVWRYPQTVNMDAGPSKTTVDAAQRFVVFNNFKRMPVCDQAVYCLDAASGRLLWQWVYDPPYAGHKQLTWRGLDISADGTRVALFAQDGRAFLLENPAALNPPADRPRVIWEKSVTRLIRVGDMDLYGYGALARFSGPQLFLVSGNTHALMHEKAGASIDHPQSNTLFAYNLAGDLLWMHKLGGIAYNVELSADRRYLLMPVRNSRSQADTLHQGIYLFDLQRPGGGRDKLLWHFQTAGICLDGSLSGDGRRILALEYPLDMDPREEFVDVRGAHRVFGLR
jgi:outer membrane protein assembly factor BamB